MQYWVTHLIGITFLAGVCGAQEQSLPAVGHGGNFHAIPQSRPLPLSFHQRLERFQSSLLGPGPIAKSLFTAGLKQWTDSPSEWGQGSAGYSRRFTYRYGVRVAANSLEFGIGSLIGEDPRYFRSEKTGLARVGHAVKSTFVAPSDAGGTRFAYARMAGIVGGAALSNAWYPDRYRTVGSTLERAGFSIAGDVAGNLLREFWPDIKRKVFKR